MTVSITLVLLSDRIFLSFLCRTSGLAHPGRVQCRISSSAGLSWRLSLIYSRAAGSSSEPFQPGVVSLDSPHGVWPCAGSQLVRSRVPRPEMGTWAHHSWGDSFGTKLQTKGIHYREWGIKDSFSPSATHGQSQAEGVFRQRDQLQSEGTNATFTVGMMGLMLLSWSSSIPSCCKTAFQ